MNLQNTNTKIASLQALRAIAIFGVFISHARFSPSLGVWGVSVFFVLSGFLMVYNYWNKNLECSVTECFKFSFSKIKKLYLLFFLTLLVMIPYDTIREITFFGPFSVSYFMEKFIFSLLMIQSWVPDFNVYSAFNGVSWFLSACAFLYFCFPFILKYIRKLNGRGAFIGLVCAFVAQVAILYLIRNVHLGDFPDGNYWTSYTCPATRLLDFVAGCCLGCIYVNNRDFRMPKAVASIVEISVFAVLYICTQLYQDPDVIFGQNWFRYTCLWMPTSLALVYMFALKRGIISTLCSCKPVIRFGDISPFVYLIHSPAIVYVGAINKRMLHIPSTQFGHVTMGCIAFLVTLISSFLWLYCTKKGLWKYSLDYLASLCKKSK